MLIAHIHLRYTSFRNGKLCAVGGSLAFQIALELTLGAAEPRPVNEPYGYMVQKVDENGVTIHRRAVAL